MPARSSWITLVGLVLLGGLVALFGFLFPYMHPAFSNQRDIDLFVGLASRLGMAIIAGLGFPPFGLPDFMDADRLKWIPWRDLYSSEK
jgi:hypothetical protein